MTTPFPEGLQRWDEDAFLVVHRLLHDLKLHDAMRFLNELGNAYVLVPIVFALALLESDTTRFVRRAAHVLLAVAIASSISDWTKGELLRDRPFTAMPTAFSEGRAQIEFNDARGSRAFPSGHTTVAFAWTVALCFAAGDIPGARRRRLARALLLLFAAGTGLARIYVGAHFPLDVLAGAVLGSAVALALGALLTRVPWLRRGGGTSAAPPPSALV